MSAVSCFQCDSSPVVDFKATSTKPNESTTGGGLNKKLIKTLTNTLKSVLKEFNGAFDINSMHVLPDNFVKAINKQFPRKHLTTPKKNEWPHLGFFFHSGYYQSD